MSKRVLRYEGRRPIYADEGPAAAGATDGLSALGRLSSLDLRYAGERLAGSNAPIERRLISAAERSIREEARPSPIAPRPAAARPSSVIQEEPTVTVTPPAEPEAIAEDSAPAVLERLSDAADAAREALLAKTIADQAWRAAQRDLAAAWRSLPPLDVGDDVVEPPADHAETIPVAAQPPPPARAHTAAESRSAGTAGMLARRAQAAALTGAAKAKAGTNGSAPAGGGPGLRPSQRRIIDALLEFDGDRPAAAKKLGYKLTSLVGSLGHIRKIGGLSDQERAILSSRRA